MNFSLENMPQESPTEETAAMAAAILPIPAVPPLRRTLSPQAQQSMARVLSRDKVSSQDLLALTHQLSATLGAGLSFAGCMEILMMPGVHRPAARQLVGQLASKVNEGCPLSDALRTRPDVFDELYISLVEAGEASAQLPETLKRLARFQERRGQLLYDVLGALLYPLFVLLFGLVIGTGMLVYGAPVVEEMYRNAGAQLPWISQMFISGGKFLGKFALVAVALGVAASPFVRMALKRPDVRKFIDQTLLSWGPTSQLFQQVATARSCRTLSVLYANGLPILRSLEITGRSSGSPVFEELFRNVAQEVKDGSKIADPLMRCPYFPSMAAGMIAAGEEAGSLSPMLDHVADYFESQINFTLAALVKFLEPLFILIVGVFVGVIVASLGIPFMNLVAVLQ